MTPERFCTEVPQRMRRLLDAMYPVAQEQDLTTSFALMVAMPLLMIPLERTATYRGEPTNAISEVDTAQPFVRALRQLKRGLFWETFLREPDLLRRWRFTEITRRIDHPSQWSDSLDRHPMRPGARNDIRAQTVENVLMTLRHALAHGNVVYLNEEGDEAPGRRVTHMAFVADGRGTDAYRVIIVEEAAFVEFLKVWADWLAGYNIDSSLRHAA
ncbi:hypothetical protein C8C95_0241 [Acidovorax sp. 99]|uniref:hypothetical protein n=1 Tax=Acidovorax sp. 99 TaxID=2135634 RepID=UPI000D5E179D|nr:hypothetical protein [Acidovorax sp. 99]PVY89438.1 hypothetical protein C8C95_0241 [Acidovorax sp. 99]